VVLHRHRCFDIARKVDRMQQGLQPTRLLLQRKSDLEWN
jgi:hypothetical protein